MRHVISTTTRFLDVMRRIEPAPRSTAAGGGAAAGGGTTAGGGAPSEEAAPLDETAEFFLYAARRDHARALARGCVGDECEIPLDALDTPFGVAAEAEAFVGEQCRALTLSSRQFCKRELEITHKELVKAQRKSGGKFKTPAVIKAIEGARAAEAASPRGAWASEGRPPADPREPSGDGGVDGPEQGQGATSTAGSTAAGTSA